MRLTFNLLDILKAAVINVCSDCNEAEVFGSESLARIEGYMLEVTIKQRDDYRVAILFGFQCKNKIDTKCNHFKREAK